MITINGVEFRNLQEQVLKNQQDILYMLEQEGALNEFGIKVVGQVTSISELPDPDTYTGEFGDAYAVGTATPYTLYIFTRANGTHASNYWFDIGTFPLAGPQGPQGDQGVQGPIGQSSKWIVNTGLPYNSIGSINDMYININNGDTYIKGLSGWVHCTNIIGPTGATGATGPQGPQGVTGPQGPQGPKGDTGTVFIVVDTLNSVDNLPDPATINQPTWAYLVGTSTPYSLYIQVGLTPSSRQWQNQGPVIDPVGTNVTVNGNFVAKFDADTKLDKLTGASAYPEAYTKEADGSQSSISISTSRLARNTLVKRTATGTIETQTPSGQYDAIPLNYLSAFGSNLIPDTDNAYTLGTQTYRIKDAYIVNAHITNIDNGTVTNLLNAFNNLAQAILDSNILGG